MDNQRNGDTISEKLKPSLSCYLSTVLLQYNCSYV